jgi:hypothetical protein
MGRLTIFAALVAAQSSAFLVSARANPCADVEWTQKAIASGFAGVPTRKAMALEQLTRPLFGEESCNVGRPVAFSTTHRITCIFLDGIGTPSDPSARQTYDRLSKTVKECLVRYNPFDGQETEHLGGEILAQSHFRSNDGRETWSLKLFDRGDPKVEVSAGYETDADKAQKNATLPDFLRNVLMGKECETISRMEALARSNFAGVEARRVRTETALVKPLADARECLVARDHIRAENVIACNWLREDPAHADWAGKIQSIRLSAVRSCRKGWTETPTRFGAKFTNAAGDSITVETNTGDQASFTGVAVTVKTAP